MNQKKDSCNCGIGVIITIDYTVTCLDKKSNVSLRTSICFDYLFKTSQHYTLQVMTRRLRTKTIVVDRRILCNQFEVPILAYRLTVDQVLRQFHYSGYRRYQSVQQFTHSFLLDKIMYILQCKDKRILTLRHLYLSNMRLYNRTDYLGLVLDYIITSRIQTKFSPFYT